MTRERIDSLADENRRLHLKVEGILERLDQIGPEKARLEEALGNAESNHLIATTLVVVGGFMVSYAGFTGDAAATRANVAAGILLAGLGMMGWRALGRRKSG